MNLDYGFRSKCCLAPIRLGRKKIRKTGQYVQVWVCCSCAKKNIMLLSTEEAGQIRNKDYLKPDIDSDGGYAE